MPHLPPQIFVGLGTVPSPHLEEAVGPLSSLNADPMSVLCLPQAGSVSALQGAGWGDGASSLVLPPAAPQPQGAGPVQGAGPWGRLPGLATPLGAPGAPGLEGTIIVPSPRLPPLSSQLLYLKLILNFLFEETK